MLEIRNSTGKVLDIPQAQTITIEILSTLFSEEDVLPGSRSLPINVPMTERNQQFFEGKWHYHTDSFPEIPVSVTMCGQTQYNCLLNYRVKNSRIESYLKIDLGQLAAAIKSTRLKDILTQQVSIGTSAAARATTMKTIATAEPGTYPIAFFPMKNDNFFEENYQPPSRSGVAFGFQKYVNWWDVESETFVVDGIFFTIPGFPTGGVRILGFLIVPFVYVRHTIEQVCLHLGLKAVGSWLDEYETRRLVWDNNIAIEENYYNGQVFANSVVRVGDFAPDLTIAEFFKALRGFFGVGIFVNTMLKEVLFKTAKKLTYEEHYVEVGFAQQSKFTADQEAQKGITLENNVDSSDEIYKAYPPTETHVIGEGEKKVPLKIGTLPMVWEHNPDFNTAWVIPATKTEGNVSGNLYQDSARWYNKSQNATPPNECPLRVLIYHGLQPTSTGESYPLASSISINQEGEKIASYSLWPNEPDSIFYVLQQHYYHIINNERTITSEHRMPFTQMAKIRPETKIAGRLDGLTLSKFLLKQLSHTQPDDAGFVQVQLKLVPVKPNAVAASQINDPTEINTYVEILFKNSAGEIVLDLTEACDLWAVFWTTPTRTTSQSVTDMGVIISAQNYDSQFGGGGNVIQTFFCTGIEAKLLTNVTRYLDYTDNDVAYFSTTEYSIVPTNYYRIL